MGILKQASAAMALATLLGTSAWGQQLTTSGTFLDAFSPEVPLGFTIGQGASYTFDSNLKNGVPGDFNVTRLETTVSYRKKWDNSRLNVTFDYEYSDYQWGSGAPNFFGSTNELGLSAIYQYDFDYSDWGAYAIASASLGAETSATLTDGNAYTLSAGGSYSPFKDLTISFGALFISNPEQSVRVWPVAFLDWRINEYLTLRTFNGATLVYDVNADRKTVLDFTVQYNSRTYRLNNQPIPTQGVNASPAVEEESVSATVGVTHRFGGPFYVRAFVQGDFLREFEYRANQNKYQTIKTDPGLTLGIEVGADF